MDLLDFHGSFSSGLGPILLIPVSRFDHEKNGPLDLLMKLDFHGEKLNIESSKGTCSIVMLVDPGLVILMVQKSSVHNL